MVFASDNGPDADFPDELSMANIDREDFPGAILQKAIGKTTGGSADVERDVLSG